MDGWMSDKGLLIIPAYGNSYRRMSREGMKMELPREGIPAIKHRLVLKCYLLKIDGIWWQLKSIVSFNFISTDVIVKYCQDNNTKKFLLGIFFFFLILAEDKQEGKTGIESPSM